MVEKIELSGKVITDRDYLTYKLKGDPIHKDYHYLVHCDYEDYPKVNAALKDGSIDLIAIWNKPAYFICRVTGQKLPYLLNVLEWRYGVKPLRERPTTWKGRKIK